MRSGGKISVLLVEDNLADACYIIELLRPDMYLVRRASSLSLARASLESAPVNVILLDLSLPDSTGLQTCVSMIEYAPETPIVILTGLDSDELGAQAVNAGAQDFILKREIDDNSLHRSIRYAIERETWRQGVRKTALLAIESEASAREVAANLKLILKASKTGIWSWDIINDVVTSDEQNAEIFGIEFGTFGDNVQALIDRIYADDVKELQRIIQAAIENKGEYTARFRITRPDGTIRYVANRGQVLLDSNGMAVRMAGVITDVTKEREEEENAKRLLLLEQHEDFISTLTHDLKNPLIGAERLLGLFLDGALGHLDDEQRKMLEMMRQSNSEMLGMVQDLLQVYRMEAGVPPQNFTHCDVQALANSCISRLASAAESSGLELHTTFAPGGHTISADPVALRRVLMNLLGNAIKFTNSGGDIFVAGLTVNDSYVLQVSDTGAGIAQKDVEKLFQRFSQAALGKNNCAGTGLGLYLCRQLVEAGGGTITCSSVEGSGSTFTVILPMKH